MTRAKALALRRILLEAIKHLDDELAEQGTELFPAWKSGKTYAVGDRVKHNDLLYKCVQAHTSQDDWTPAVAASLWARAHDPSEEWPEWIQPTGAHDAYAKDAKVSHNGKHWISNVDSNVWEPPTMWTEAE